MYKICYFYQFQDISNFGPKIELYGSTTPFEASNKNQDPTYVYYSSGEEEVWTDIEDEPVTGNLAGDISALQTLYSKLLCFNTSLKVGVMSAFSYPSSTVNSTHRRWFGDTQNIASFRNASDGTFTTAKTLVPECLDLCDILTIRQFFRKYLALYGCLQ
ncbi:hypothetical protein K503DRAFT_855858, partial [Rhizopogon vinicolor AM-OR11-026]